MQLKQLKLAGFKSFVDLTILTFPSPLVAVVGPNGCGKSNIIDAIRWVLGESSAKHLRGDTMVDVIFKGSSHRKAVGQASVELIFDNSLGTVLGSIAAYAEISLKRILTRDGDSSYYLNGARCRRRDIMDIFLGTGAGAQGYSIISQGDISRLIEAKPEVLRGYLEEAAGISKYQYRRRETMLRIQNTRENLIRITDIREELAKKLQHLETQGKVASRYLQLKEEEHRCRAEILALKWRDLQKLQQLKTDSLQQLAQDEALKQQSITEQQKNIDLLQEKISSLEINGEQCQKKYYLSGTELTRLQEVITQRNSEKKRLYQDQQQLQNDTEKSSAHIINAEAEVQQLNTKSLNANTQLLSLKQQITEQEQQLLELTTAHHTCQHQHNEMQININDLKNQKKLAELKWQNNEEQYQQTQTNLEKIAKEAETMNINALEAEAKILINEEQLLTQEKLTLEKQIENQQDKILQSQISVHEIDQILLQVQNQYHQIKSEHSALQSAHNALIKPVKNYPVQEWITQQRLIDILEVEEKWQFAIEYVLGDQIKALVLSNTEEFCNKISLLSDVGEAMVTLISSKETKAEIVSNPPRLSEKIKSAPPSLVINLQQIYAFENFESARAYQPRLKINESIITPEGVWFGVGWMCLPQSKSSKNLGLLERQQKIATLAKHLTEYKCKLDYLCERSQQMHLHLENEEHSIKFMQKNLQLCLDALQTHKTKEIINNKSLEFLKQRQVVLEEQRQDLCIALEALSEKKQLLLENKERFIVQWQSLTHKEQTIFVSVSNTQTEVNISKSQLDNLKNIVQQQTLLQDRANQKIQVLQENIIIEQERLKIFIERKEMLSKQIVKLELDDENMQKKLLAVIQEHTETEDALQSYQKQVIKTKQSLGNLEVNLKTTHKQLKIIEENNNLEHLAIQALTIRIQAIEEALEEQFLKPSDLLISLSDNLTPNLRESALSVMMENINKLGAINLAAIEEFNEEEKRKKNLDEQYVDLQEALLMLESAIKQMDRETQVRLHNTFNQINDLFQKLFPRLFGGGTAYLELTSNNLLEAGVIVMAQPPGKRNSSIQLLSGGEKAMTALALVFAIFQLNPSPFCMLDEVDAPLDDLNVTRFCNVVKEMSKFVQFLFITHNKITMEMADQLIGVTMREPGVSRLVTVDIIDMLE